MDLTVITVCRNAAPTIQRCIDSVSPLLRHPVLSVEHLIIDGVSTDATLEILTEQLAMGRITRFISEPDGGIYDAMNKGIALAAGKVCVFINADDEINAEAVESCCAPILSGEVDYTVSTVRIMSEEGEMTGIQKPDFSREWVNTPYCHQSMFCRTEMLRREGGFRLDLGISADCALMWHLYKKQYPYRIVEAVSAHFYSGGASSGGGLYSEHLRIYLENSVDILQSAAIDAQYRKLALKHLRSYMRLLSENEVNECKISPLIAQAAALHKVIVGTMPRRGRLFLWLSYKRQYLINKFGALFSKKRKRTKQSRCFIYSYLSKFC